MNNPNEKQHYVSRVLLERFRIPGRPLQCFQIATGEWKERSVENVCASRSYNQVMEKGQADNTIEEAFSKVESDLPKTFRALEEAATKSSTDLPANLYENICKYCAFLKLTSPIAKAGAVVSFVIQLNWELEKGQNYLLRDLNLPEQVIDRWRKECAIGHKIVIETENPLQLLFKLQFQQSFALEYSMFRSTRWTVGISAMELPMSDIGLVSMHVEDLKANHFILPIGPKLVLDGILYLDPAKNSAQPIARGVTLTDVEAEYRFDCICSSAVTEIVCSSRIQGISAALVRSKEKGINFHEILNLRAITSAGQTETNSAMRYRVVSTAEYVQFVHSFIKPKWKLKDS